MTATTGPHPRRVARETDATQKARPLSPSPRAWNTVPWLCLALSTAVALVQPALLATAGLYIWAASIVILGLPHGACDPLVLPRLHRAQWTLRETTLFYLFYLCAAGAVIVLWTISSIAGLLFFLVLTVWHWGSADAMARGRGSLWYLVGGIARGVIVIVAPLAFHPIESIAMFAGLLAVVDPAGSSAHVITVSAPLYNVLRITLGSAVLVELVGLAHDLRYGHRRRAAAAVIDLAVLLTLYRFTPPVAAVGLYFVAWHSWRHVLRVGSLLADGPASAQQLVVRYYARAWPLTVVSIVGLTLVTITLRQQSLSQIIATYLVLISAVTLPHALVVAAWDRRARYVEWRNAPIG